MSTEDSTMMDTVTHFPLNDEPAQLIQFNPENKPIFVLEYKDVYKNENNFTKGCKWAPDGTCLLVASNDQKFRIFDLSQTVSNGNFNDEQWLIEGYKKENMPTLVVEEGEMVFDYTWYPQMTVQDSSTQCFAVTCRDMPVHLWDAWHGEIVCSYITYNHLEQLIAARSLCFSPCGKKLACGYNKAIRIFDTSRPGKQSSNLTLDGQTGIISCLDFHPVLQDIFAAGSYLGSVGFYSLKSKKTFTIFEGHQKGVTQVKFSKDGTKLFSASRKDGEILCWDIRNPGQLLSAFKRKADTNQKIYFDLTPQNDDFLLSGSTTGEICVWNMKDSLPEIGSDDPDELAAYMSFQAHSDCVNGVSVHPSRPILATSSGQRVVKPPVGLSNSDSDEEDNGKFSPENNVKLWWLGNM